MTWFHSANCPLRLGVRPGLRSPAESSSGASDESPSDHLVRKWSQQLLDYHTLCVRHGFDSMAAAEYLRGRHPDFLQVARALNRLLMKAYLAKSDEQGRGP